MHPGVKVQSHSPIGTLYELRSEPNLKDTHKWCRNPHHQPCRSEFVAFQKETEGTINSDAFMLKL